MRETKNWAKYMHTIDQIQRTLDAKEEANFFAPHLQLSSHSCTCACHYDYY